MTALPTLRQLSILVAIAESGSFSRAAERIGLTQPALSASIKELETLLGAILIERDARGAALTPAGVETVTRAQRILAEAADLTETIQGLSVPLSGTFRLGVIPTIAPFLLPKALPVIRNQFPALKLFLREEQTARLIEGLRSRALDAALIALPYEAAGISHQEVAQDEFLFIAPRQHRLSNKNDLVPDDLADEELLLLEDGHCLRDHALSICGRSSQGGKETAAGATSLHTLVQMVANGLGVSLLPRMAAEAGVTAGAEVALTPFGTPIFGRTIGVVWRNGSAREAEARLLGTCVARALKGHPV